MYETYNSTTFSENDKEANKVDEKYNINNFKRKKTPGAFRKLKKNC